MVHETNIAPPRRAAGGFEEVALDPATASTAKLPILVNGAVVQGADGSKAGLRVTVIRAPERCGYERAC